MAQSLGATTPSTSSRTWRGTGFSGNKSCGDRSQRMLDIMLSDLKSKVLKLPGDHFGFVAILFRMWKASRVARRLFGYIGKRPQLGDVGFLDLRYSEVYFKTGKLLCQTSAQRSVSALDKARSYKEGDKIHGYTVEKVTEIADFHSIAVKLRHDDTGAEHFHLARDDQNNVFSVSFRTTPMDSTGVPHILEHTTLCGSQKYPCRDPFFKMLNRSLATFMNAWTASDYTMYPFSTQNRKDFSNLLSVYLDAVFFPNLRELDFWQEGWRLEHEVTEDQKSPIIFKGVVFNEMKGALSTAEALFATRLQNLILPNHTYGYISGGDPQAIPNLTWEQLKDFHATHYHPSNSKFYTYGDLDLEEHLKSIEALALRHFKKIEPGTEIPEEPKWTVPRHAYISCPPDPLAANPEKQTMASVSYMLDSLTDPFDAFTMGILSALLVSGPNAPFYRSLIEPNIGSDYSPVVGFDGSTRNPTFSVGLQGLNKVDVPKVLEIIQDTFKKAAEEGFDSDRIASILHRIEVSQKHQSSNFGLGVIASLMASWNQDNNPIDRLEIDKTVEKFKGQLAENRTFLQDKVKELFLDNPHKLTLVMSPEDDFNRKKEVEEEAMLKAKVDRLNDIERTEIFEKGLQLMKQQSDLSDVSCLPKMNVSDIDKEAKGTTIDREIVEGVNLQICEQPTNGITYFRAITNVSSLPYILKPYLPLFCHVATKMGAGGRNYRELAQEVEMYTGGLGISTHLSSDASKIDNFEQGVMFSSHCLDRNLPQMFSLWQDIFVEPFLTDKDRLRTLVNSLASDLAMSIPDSGHMYALTAASGGLTPSARFGELFGGLTQVHFMKEMAEQEDLEQLTNNLIQIAYHLLNINDMRCALNVAPESRVAATSSFANFLGTINSIAGDEVETYNMPSFQPKGEKLFIQMPFPVNYVSRCVRAVPYNHEDAPRLRILAKLLSAKFLHREIREKGGAYGSGARLGGGVFGFFSYRDPNTTNTIKTFNDSVSWACNGSFSNDDIDEAKLSVFSAVDSPVSPANKGLTLFTSGITDEMRQTHRNRLFEVSKDDLVDVANRYLLPGRQVESSAIIGAESKDFASDDSWKIKKETIEAMVS